MRYDDDGKGLQGNGHGRRHCALVRQDDAQGHAGVSRTGSANCVGRRAAAGTVLEVAPGPGFLSIELAKRGLDVQAVDISKTFVKIARKNAAEAGVRAVFMHGNAAELPVRKESVDFVVCRAAFKNFQNR